MLGSGSTLGLIEMALDKHIAFKGFPRGGPNPNLVRGTNYVGRAGTCELLIF
jgi:hypothetical protein